MLLQRLYELRSRLSEDDVPPAYYKTQAIDWIIEIRGDGSFGGFSTTGDDFKDDTPYIIRAGSRPAPFLLADKHTYLLGYNCDAKVAKLSDDQLELAQTKATERHEDFLQLLEGLWEACEGELPPGLRAVRAFYQGDGLSEARRSLIARTSEQRGEETSATGDAQIKVKESQLFAFRVDEQIFPHRLREVKRFWADYQDQGTNEASGLSSMCLLSGEEKPIAQIHPNEFLLGPDRTMLISANAKAFESYGLKKSEIAPLSVDAARRYGEGLKFLLNSRRHSLRVGGVYYVFWAKEPQIDPFFASSVIEPDPEVVQNLLKSAQTGSPSKADLSDFYAAALTAQKARLVVRDYIETTVGHVKQALVRWFQDTDIVDTYGAEGSPISLLRLAGSLLRQGARLDELSPQIIPMLFKRALQGLPVPAYVLQQLLLRIRAEPKAPLPHARAALLRLSLNDQMRRQDGFSQELLIMSQLNSDERRPAYLCGRLFAALENAQRAALGAGIKSTISDRFFGTASSAPASVFGVLIRNSQAHLQKLRKNNGPAYHRIQERLEEIMSGLDEYPNTLSLQEQGLFSLGYYHQRADDRRQMMEHKAKKQEPSEDTPVTD